ncbi:MAG: LacI family DNA-binding transcriptional regulator, partial [Ruminococcaceae bacterium]|nr:LacI family DNA-binding transcriptional regulator [Oscillospiraceae bacterium]
MRRVTLSDIARACGVSVNTVSHALHDKPDISEQTKDRIKKTAEEMGYIQNTSASF